MTEVHFIFSITGEVNNYNKYKTGSKWSIQVVSSITVTAVQYNTKQYNISAMNAAGFIAELLYQIALNCTGFFVIVSAI